MKRLAKCFLGVFLALIAVCCVIVVACTLTEVQLNLEAGEGMTFTGNNIEQDSDGGYYMPVARGRVFSTDEIVQGKDYTLEDGYSLTGWTLIENDELHEIDEAEGETALSFSFTIQYGGTYKLIASTQYKEADFTIDAEGLAGITVNTSTFSIPDGAYFDPYGNAKYAVPDGSYTLDTDNGYTVSGWTLYVNDTETEIPSGGILVQSGNTYRLVPTVEIADITVKVVDTDGSEITTITQQFGTTIDLSDISYNPPTGYTLSGWTLTIDGADATDKITDNAITLDHIGEYVLTPVIEQAYTTISLTVSAGSSSQIQILEGYETISASIGTSFVLSDEISEGTTYTISTGYEISWSLLVDGTEDESFNGSFTPETGKTYALVASAVPVDVTVNLAVYNEATQETTTLTPVIKPYDGTFSVQDDISYTPDAGYEIKGYTVQEGSGTARSLTEDETEFDITSTAGYTVTIQVGYIELSYVIYQQDGTTVITSDTTYYGATLDLSSVDLSWIEEGYSLGHWDISITLKDTGETKTDTTADETYIINDVGDYTFTASLIHDEMHVIIYNEAYVDENTTYTTFKTIGDTDKIYVGSTINLSTDIGYSAPDGYKLTGWTLKVDYKDGTTGSSTYETTDSFTLDKEGSYKLYPVLEQIEVTITLEGSEGISIVSEYETIKSYYGTLDLEGSWYSLTDGYKFTKWTLTKGSGSETEVTDTYITIDSDEAYTLKAYAEKIQTTLTIKDKDGNVLETINPVYGTDVYYIDSLASTYYSSLDTTCWNLTGWTLTIGSSEYDTPTTYIVGQSSTVTILYEEIYVLQANCTQIATKVSIQKADDADSNITISTDSVLKSLNDGDFVISTELEENTDYTLSTGYKVTWTLYVNNVQDNNFNGTSFSVSEGNTYILKATAVQMQTTLIIQDKDGNQIGEVTNVVGGETITVSDSAYTDLDTECWTITGWTLTIGGETDGTYTNGQTFTIASEDAYVLQANCTQIATWVAIEKASDEDSYITINNSSILKSLSDTPFEIGTDLVEETDYTLSTGYKVTWTLYVGEDIDSTFDGSSFTVEAGKTYTLKATTVQMEATLTVLGKDNEELSSTTAYGGTTITIDSSLQTTYYGLLDTDCWTITGWTLTIGSGDSTTYTVEEGASFTISTEETYTLKANCTQIATWVSIEIADGSSEHITLNDTSVLATLDTPYSISELVSSEVCAPATGYKLVWSLKKGDETDNTFSEDSYTYLAGNEYTLVVSASPVEVEITVEVTGIDGVTITGVEVDDLIWTVTKYYDETFSLDSDTGFDSDNYTGYKFDHYALDGSKIEADFKIESVSGYTLTIYVDYITYTYTFCDEGGNALSGDEYSGDTHIGDTITLPEYTPSDEDYSLLGWIVYIDDVKQDGLATGESYEVNVAGNYKFVASTQLDTLHVIAYDVNGNVLQNIAIEPKGTFNTAAISYTPEDDEYGTYVLTGWNLFIDDASEATTTLGTNEDYTVGDSGSYKLVAVVKQVTVNVYLSIDSESTDLISILTDSPASIDLSDTGDTTFNINDKVSYVLTVVDDEDLYEVTWSLKVGDEDGTITNNSFTVVAGTKYELVVHVEQVLINVSLSADSDSENLISFTEDAISKTLTDGVATFTLSTDLEDVYSITATYPSDYTLTWTLMVDGEADGAFDGTSFTAEAGKTYELIATVEQISSTITISAADGSEDYITIEDGTTITITIGDTLDVSDEIITGTYDLTYGYTITWTLMVNGTEDGSFDGTTTIEAGKTYELVASASLAQVNVTVVISGVEADSDTVTKTFGDTFSLASDVAFDITNYEGYEIKGYSLQIGENAASTVDADFKIESTDDYILTVYVGLSEVSITIQDTEYATYTGEELDGYMGYEIDLEAIEQSMTCIKGYEITGWTLTVGGVETSFDGTKITVDSLSAYVLTPVTSPVDVSVTVGSADHVSFTTTDLEGYYGYVIDLDTLEESATLDYGYEITGWTLTIGGETATYEGTTITVTELEDYVVTPVVTPKPVSISITAAEHITAITDYTLDNGYYVTDAGYYGYEIDLETLESAISLDTGYEITGWSLTVGGTATAITGTTITINSTDAYVITPVVTPVDVEISITAAEHITSIGSYELSGGYYIVDGGYFGYVIDLDNLEAAASLEYGYEITGWSLTVGGIATGITGTTITIDSTSDYVLTPTVSPKAVSISVTAADHITGITGYTLESGYYVTDAGYYGYVIDLEDLESAINLDTGYEITDWSLTVGGTATGITGTTITINSTDAYVITPVVTPVDVEISITASEHITSIGSYELSEGYYIVDGGYFGYSINLTTLEAAVSLDDGYEITGWTLTVGGAATDIDGTTILVNSVEAYVLTPVVEGKEVVVSIVNKDGDSLDTYTTKVGETPSLDDILAECSDMASYMTGTNTIEYFNLKGWAISMNGGTATEITDTISIGADATTSGAYVISPIVEEYGYITLTLTGMTEYADQITLGTVDGNYDGETEIIVGNTYSLPEETAGYITYLAETYGIKGWVVYDSSSLSVASYTVALVGDEVLLSLTSGGTYTLVPVVDHYYTVNATEDVSSFALTEMRVYDTDEDGLVLPDADSLYITSTASGETLSGWYVEAVSGTEDEPVYTVYGGTNGLYSLGATVGSIDSNLIIWPVYADSEYPLSTNDDWLAQRGSTVAITDHAGTVLGVNSYTDIWHYISDTYMYDKDDNVADYTIVNISTETGESTTLVAGYWFRLNTVASTVTLTDGQTYDIYYAFTNFTSTDITFTLYVCSNGYLDQSDTGSTGYTRSYTQATVTVPANSTVEIVLYGFQEKTATAGENVSENNFLTIIQFADQCTDLALGVRSNVTESNAAATGTVYIEKVTGMELGSDWTADDSETWMTRDYTVGTSIQLTEDGIDYSLIEGYVIIGWYVLDNNGNAIGDLQATDYSFTLSSSAVYLYPVVLYYTAAYGNVSLASGIDWITLDSETYANNEDDYFSYVDNADAVLPTAEQVTNDTSGKTLTGWYVETEAGVAVGTYELGGSVSGMKTNLVIYPVYEETYYRLTVNDSDKSGMITDHAGTEIGSDLGTNYTSLITETELYNTNDNVMEYAITKASGQTLPAGYWFRTNTFVTSGSGRQSTSTETYLEGGLVANAYYDVYYALTNHGSVDITITIYHCTNGYLIGYPTVTDTANYASQTITILAGETAYISFSDFCEKDTTANNFITVYQLSNECSDFQLGMRIWIEEAKSTINISTTNVTGFTLVAESDWNSKRVTKGVSVTVPEYDVDFSIADGYVFLGWYIVDDNDNELEFIADGGTISTTDSSIIIKPYVVTTTEATKSLTVASSVDSGTFSLTNAVTFQVGRTDSTLTLPVDEGSSDNVTNSTGRTLMGWYVTDAEGNVFGTSENGIYLSTASSVDAEYDVGATLTITALTGNLIIWPVLSDSEYDLVANSNRETETLVSDISGTVIGTSSSALNNYLTHTNTYDDTANVQVYTILDASTSGESMTFSAGSWFRINTLIASGTVDGDTLAKGSYYNFTYMLYNYDSADLTITLYHCTNGYLAASGTYATNASASETVTIPANGYVCINFYKFLQDTTADTTPNFITIFEFMEETSSLRLGVRVGVSDYEDGTIPGTVVVDTSSEYITAEEEDSWFTQTFYIGTTYSMPEEDADFTITEGYTLLGWYVTDANGNILDIVDTTYSFTLDTTGMYFAPYILSSGELTRTVAVASVDGVSVSTTLSYTLGSDTTVTLPASGDVTNDTERTLSGWYVEDALGNAYGTASNGIYDLGSTLTVTAITQDLTIYPVLSDSTYMASTNSGFSGTAGYVTDVSGVAVGTTTGAYNSVLTSTTAYCKADNVNEFTVVNDGTTLTSGSWFRINTNSASGETLGSSNTYYTFYYSLTNHSSESITLTIYHCTNGYMASSGTYKSNNYAGRQVTIAPDETIYVTFYHFEQKSTATNYITVIEVNQDVTELALGIRTKYEVFVDDVVADFSVDLTGIENFTVDESYPSTSGTPTTYCIGTIAEVPTEEEYTNDTGMTLAGWYYYDENGSLVDTVSANGQFTITSSTVVLVPYFT